jgi:predicted site-specific integrase-resolvase
MRDTDNTLLVRQPEACRLLGGISKHTLRELIADGRLETVVLRPNGWPRVTRASIERLSRGSEPSSEASP